MSILIGGDLVPYGKTEKIFESGDTKLLLGLELLDIWSKADYRFFNLECPITNVNTKILKSGPNIKCSTESIKGIKRLDPNCVFLANNHILDYSINGLKDTIDILDRNNINYIGVGKNIYEMKKTFTFLYDDKNIAIYNCCEHEFSVATNDSYGANPYANYTLDDIKQLKKVNDYVVIVYHGGREHYRYPSPKLQERCRLMVDAGADLVICQHSHCIGCEEKYNSGIIVYGQGNFIFNMQKNKFWNTSLLIDIDVSCKKFNIKYIPITQTSYGTRLASKDESKKILDEFYERSELAKNEKFIQKEYKELANSSLNNYILKIYGNPLWLRIIKKTFPRLFSKIKFDYTTIFNILECEAHNELFAEGLKNKIKTMENKDT